MGVAVLHPHDCLQKKPYHPPPTMKPPNSVPKPRSSRTRHKRNNAAATSDPKPQVNNNNKQLIGQVKILKRGEQLPKTTPFPPQPVKKENTKATSSPEKKVSPGSEKLTEMTPFPSLEKKVLPLPVEEKKLLPLPVKEVKVSPLPVKVTGNMYAGSSTVSPPPSSVPLPLFITKKIAIVSDATADLRRMLRLDFP